MEQRREGSGDRLPPDQGRELLSDRFRVDNFEAVARRMVPESRELLHELTVGVFWPHRPHDLDVFISLGNGYLAVDEIGRALGSVMYYEAGSDFAMFGMMVTAPRLQTLGTGRWLLRRVMADCKGRDIRLSATHSGYPLYKSEGFLPLTSISQHQGVVRTVHVPNSDPSVSLRDLRPQDEAAVRVLDRHAYGAERCRIMDKMLWLSSGVVAEASGEIRGYALAREFGRGVVIGPVVAGDDTIAMMLTAYLIQRHLGQFVRLDTPVKSERFHALLISAGMLLHDTVTEMYFGAQRRPLEGMQVYALAAHSLG